MINKPTINTMGHMEPAPCISSCTIVHLCCKYGSILPENKSNGSFIDFSSSCEELIVCVNALVSNKNWTN